MKNKLDVPFYLCRTGAVVEFVITGSRPMQGTIKHLVAHGARNFLAVLSRRVDHDGKVCEGFDEFTRMEPTVNLCHATRVLQHSKGDVTFEPVNRIESVLKDTRELRASRGFARRGKRIVLTCVDMMPDTALEILVQEYLLLNRATLGVQPWEVVDIEGLLDAMKKAGVAKVTMTTPQDWLTRRIDIRKDKLSRFVRQNINRFKCNLDAEEKARHEFDEQMYREEMQAEYGDEFGAGTYRRRCVRSDKPVPSLSEELDLEEPEAV